MVVGQQIHASSDSLFIYPGDGLPVGAQWADDLKTVYVNEIDSVLFQEGGNKLGSDVLLNEIQNAIDLNLNQPFVVPEQELPTSGEQEPFILPEHELGLSGVRFMLGLSIYF